MTMDSIVVDNCYTGLQVTNYLIEKKVIVRLDLWEIFMILPASATGTLAI